MISEDTTAKPLHRTWEAARQRAQGMLEYAALLALVALVVVAKATDLGAKIAALLDWVATNISTIPKP
jgi:Flp pilus assembly pilin Flp